MKFFFLCLIMSSLLCLTSTASAQSGEILSLFRSDSPWGCFIGENGSNSVVRVSPAASPEARDSRLFVIRREFSTRQVPNRWIRRGLEREMRALVRRGRKAKRCLAERSLFSNPNSGQSAGGVQGSGDEACEIIAGGPSPQNRSLHHRIINGSKCSIEDSAIVELSLNRDSFGGLCSGVVVGPNKILSSAHCVVSTLQEGCTRNVTSISVFVSGNLFETTADISIHPDYDCSLTIPGAGRNDVIVITTSGTLPSQRISVLSDSSILIPGAELLIAGYGLIDRDGDGSADGSSGDGLHAGFMSLVSVSSSEILSRFLFAQENPGANTCAGDSGGPALVRVGDQYFVAGLTSYGTSRSCGPNDQTVGFVNLTDPSVQSFLQNNGV